MEQEQSRRKNRRKRKRRNRSVFRLMVFAALAFLLYRGLMIASGGRGIAFLGKEINLKSLECPDYVDVQLLDIGRARSGSKLEAVNSIVVHYVGNPGTTAQNNHDYFAKPDTQVCSHFVIGLEGEVIQCLPLDERSVASNHRNKDTISIEVCHPDSGGKFTQESYDSTVRLCAWLCRNSGLKASDVIRHYDVTGKLCPLYYAKNQEAWDQFIKDVERAMK